LLSAPKAYVVSFFQANNFYGSHGRNRKLSFIFPCWNYMQIDWQPGWPPGNTDYESKKARTRSWPRLAVYPLPQRGIAKALS
jgi:hypothetical protein